ncbi:endonuclease/exonuclease/phosphatase family protein [Streptomyces sp. SID5475]|nr:endonuclease/exonuclease/phosphatase family protein [Streptomyces sp. SID5475]
MLTYGDDTLRFVGCNLEHDGGLGPDGTPGERWHIMHKEILAPLRPDGLFRQEATHSREEGHDRLHAAERALGGMRGFIGQPGVGKNPTALLVRPETFPVVREYRPEKGWRTPPTNIVTEYVGVPGSRIVMVSWHGAFNSPRAREREADELAALADKTKQGMAFIGFGDCNEYPVPVGETVPLPNWTDPDITDLPHIMHRTNQAPDGSRISCTYLDETLLGCGLHDPARYAAHHLGQKHALDPTAGHASTSGQGGGRRIDRCYLDPRLVRAVVDVEVIDTTGVSDHHALQVDLSRRGVEEALRGNIDPLPPVALTA